MTHLLRVWANVQAIAGAEGGDLRLLLSATILHDCVHVAKSSPLRPQASRMAAQRAAEVLTAQGWPAAGIAPQTPEARILQDADRLDAMGFIGVARCLWLAGARGSAIHDAEDPAALARRLDDQAFALDHFPVKLLRLAQGFQTQTGARLASSRHAALQGFYEGLLAELQPSTPRSQPSG